MGPANAACHMVFGFERIREICALPPARGPPHPTICVHSPFAVATPVDRSLVKTSLAASVSNPIRETRGESP